MHVLGNSLSHLLLLGPMFETELGLQPTSFGEKLSDEIWKVDRGRGAFVAVVGSDHLNGEW